MLLHLLIFRIFDYCLYFDLLFHNIAGMCCLFHLLMINFHCIFVLFLDLPVFEGFVVLRPLCLALVLHTAFLLFHCLRCFLVCHVNCCLSPNLMNCLMYSLNYCYYIVCLYNRYFVICYCYFVCYYNCMNYCCYYYCCYCCLLCYLYCFV